MELFRAYSPHPYEKHWNWKVQGIFPSGVRYALICNVSSNSARMIIRLECESCTGCMSSVNIHVHATEKGHNKKSDRIRHENCMPGGLFVDKTPLKH